MRAVLTGASGFVGANLAMRLLRDGHEVHLFLRPESKLWRLEPIIESVRIHNIDLRDAEAVQTAIHTLQPDWVMHLATYGAYSHQTDLHRMIDTNISGTSHLLNACRNSSVQAFINTGSSSEYGLQPRPTMETDRLDPNSYYAVTKAAATHLSSYLSQQLDIPVTTLRLYSVYGPYEEPGRLIPNLLRFGLDGRYPPLVRADTARDFVYIDDVIDAYMAVIARRDVQPGQQLGRAIYNVGSGRQATLGEIVDLVREQIGLTDPPVWGGMEQRHWDTNSWVGDNTRMRQDFGWTPRHSLVEGLSKTLGWMRDHSNLYPLPVVSENRR